MQNNKENIEFLNELSNILSKKISPITTISSISKLYKTYLNIEKINFVIWDNNNMMLKDFVQDWKFFDEKNESKEINFTYTNLSAKKGKTFYFNETEYSCEISKEEIKEINENLEDENHIIYPMTSNGDVFGLIKIKIEKQNYTRTFFEITNIASKLISSAIINYILNEQMEISLNFYKAMKDIAKIIESQYELSYIIPLIGEMIDRFMSSHLIYIFIYKDEKYKLVWPSACKEKSIYNLLEKINHNTDFIISENGKTGAFPIINEEKHIIGAIVAYSNIDKLLQKDIDYLLQLTRQSGMTIQRANVYAEVLKYATMDALTGLNNRRQFEIRLKQEVSNSKRNNTPLCCMMLDVDYFKKVNDTYGHTAGDCVLKAVSNIIKNEIREYDIACRYGGEEFFIILPQTNIKEASLVAQRLRKVIEEAKMDILDAGIENIPYLKVTISVGVCAFENSMNANDIAIKVDKALYDAKETGRNRVIIAE
ncbi:MAG: GGDEF domain-containing protein [Cyanobacteria bacterium SIG29]|nr:GGDEF domain-containing protein [Cyanobacteria bacterium SIG29]